MLPKVVVGMMERDPLLSALHITDIGYYPAARHHYRERNEPIDRFVLIYCVDGKGWVRVNGKTYSVSPHQYFILPAHVCHCYASDDEFPWTIYWIHFKGSTACSYAQNGIPPTVVCPGCQSRIDDRIRLFDEMFNAVASGFSLENLGYAMSLLHYYLGSLRYLQQFRAFGHREDDRAGGVGLVVHFMKENIGRRLSLQQMADFTGYSAPYLSKLFKEHIGHSPLAYFNVLKVHYACLLLDTTRMKLNQICYKVGIEDSYYFSRMFSKIMGMSPKAYRERERV